MNTGWFQRATAVFGRSEPVPQLYRVTCECGEVLSGVRGETSQKAPCGRCSQLVFVLPLSPYPLPASMQPRKPDAGVADAPASGKRRQGTKTAKGTPANGLKSRKGTGKPPEPSSAPASTIPLGQQLRAQLTPVRMLAVALVVGLLAATTVVYRKLQWDHAQRVLQTLLDNAEKHARAREYADADRELIAAAAALDVLGRRDPDANRWRQRGREIHVAAHLQSDGLSDLVLQHLAEGAEPGKELILPSGRWLVFDVPVYPASGETTPSEKVWQLDLPLKIQDLAVRVLLKSSAVDDLLLGTTVETPRRLIFAAELDRLDKPTSTQAEATVWLKPSSVVLWSDGELYTDLFGPTADAAEAAALNEILTQQTEVLETQP